MEQLFEFRLVKLIEQFESKNTCLEYMTEMLAESGALSFPDRFLSAVRGREEIMSTGIGRGVAIPHARDLTVTQLKIAVCVCNRALEFQAIDDQPVRLIFLIAVPQGSNNLYMKILRSLSEYLRQDDQRNKLLNATDEKELFEYVHDIEIRILGELNP
ncbi:MAG: PTS sugar transporter subunit IIA [Proteiniphilum sp.]|nr:PTS sugar transporter subunit IIA [Proteiniphilum sp.]